MRSIFREKGFKMSPDDSWCLQMIFTDPEYQGKGNSFCDLLTSRNNTEIFYALWEGMMSQLIREAFAHSPEGVFTLEASNAKSRDQYAHLGFEV